jgi:hypothetical protein
MPQPHATAVPVAVACAARAATSSPTLSAISAQIRKQGFSAGYCIFLSFSRFAAAVSSPSLGVTLIVEAPPINGPRMGKRWNL